VCDLFRSKVVSKTRTVIFTYTSWQTFVWEMSLSVLLWPAIVWGCTDYGWYDPE